MNIEWSKVKQWFNNIEGRGLSTIAKLGTFLAPIVVAWMVINAMQTYLHFGAAQAVFTAAVLEIVGWGVIVSQQRASDYVAYYNKITPEEREKHNLIEIRMWQYNAMVVVYTLTVMVVLVGLKIAPDNIVLLNAAIAALALMSSMTAANYMMGQQIGKRWEAVQALVKVREEIELLERNQLVDRLRAEADADHELTAINHAIDLTEKRIEAARRAKELQQIAKEEGVNVATINLGMPLHTNGHPNPPAKPKAKKRAPVKASTDGKPSAQDRRVQLVGMLDGATTRDEVNFAELARRFDTTPQSIYRDVEALVAEGKLTASLSKEGAA